MSFEPQDCNITINRNTYYINQKRENEQRLRIKKQLDNKIMNNKFKINLAIFFICLIIITISFIFDFEIVIFKSVKNKADNGKFSLIT